MARTTDLLMLCLLLSILRFKHIVLDKITKRVVWASIISNLSPELSYNAVILEDRKKDIKLVFSTMASHYMKGKKGLLPLKEMCSIVCTDRQEKVLI